MPADDLICFTDHAQELLDQHAARRRWRGICAWLKRQRDAGIREQTAATLAAERERKRSTASSRRARGLTVDKFRRKD